MFPGNHQIGWPSFAEVVLASGSVFDRPMLDWLSRTLEPFELSSFALSLEPVLGQLMNDNYSEAMRFQLQAIELYFGSDFFIAAD